MDKIAHVLARILLSHIFILAGINKLSAGGQAYTAKQIAAVGIPAADIMVWVVIAIELVCGVALLIGLFTRLSALILAGFTVAAAVLFHTALFLTIPKNMETIQMILMMKNLAITGGLLMFVAHGGKSPLSVDYMLKR